jgi:hypothetical protein
LGKLELADIPPVNPCQLSTLLRAPSVGICDLV